LSPEEAAQALGCSRSFFDDQVGPFLRTVRLGRRRFVPVAELQRWLDENAEAALDPRRTRGV
jgi:hypothetical protein